MREPAVSAMFCVIRNDTGAIVGRSERTYYAAIDDAITRVDWPGELFTIKYALPFVKTSYDGFTHGAFRLVRTVPPTEETMLTTEQKIESIVAQLNYVASRVDTMITPLDFTAHESDTWTPEELAQGWRKNPNGDGTKQFSNAPSGTNANGSTINAVPNKPAQLPSDVVKGRRFVRRGFGDESFNGFLIDEIRVDDNEVHTSDPIPENPEYVGWFRWDDCELVPVAE